MSTKTPLISIVIPTYEMKGLGVAFLKRCLDSIYKQTVINPDEFEILVSDQSSDSAIEDFCKSQKASFALRYHRTHTGKGIAAHNLNIGIQNALGKYIKILFQDDLLVENTYLVTVLECLDKYSPQAILTCATHTKDGIDFYNRITPKENPYFLFGNNTISSPSVITFEKSTFGNQPFDESLKLLFDCDFYHRLFQNGNSIKICDSVTVANGVWEGQTQFSISEKQFTKEVRYLNWKYPNARLGALLPPYKTYFEKQHPDAPFPFNLNIKSPWWQKILWALGRKSPQ